MKSLLRTAVEDAATRRELLQRASGVSPQVLPVLRELESTLTLCRNILSCLAQSAVPPVDDVPSVAPCITRIQSLVSSRFGVPFSCMVRSRGPRLHTDARHAAMWLVRQATNASLVTIAESFGCVGVSPHTSVRHALRAVSDRMDTDPEFRSHMQSLVALIAKNKFETL